MIKVFVGNLSYHTTDADLETFLVDRGYTPTGLSILTERETGRSRGFGFVEFADREMGERMIEDLNGKSFMGRDLTVNEARPKAQRDGPREGRRDDRRRDRDRD